MAYLQQLAVDWPKTIPTGAGRGENLLEWPIAIAPLMGSLRVWLLINQRQ